MLDMKDAGGTFDVDVTLPDKIPSSDPIRTPREFYLIGLLSYCKGYTTKEAETITYCSAPSTHFWFDAADLWGTKYTSLQSKLNSTLKRTARWMIAVFIITLAINALQFVTGLFAMSHRTCSLLTAGFSAVSRTLNIRG